MLITYNELVELVEDGVIEGVDPSHINAASIDIRIGDKMLVEQPLPYSQEICLDKKQTPVMGELPPRVRSNDGIQRFWLSPGQFALADTVEKFNLPDDIACEYRLKSSLARAGLNASLAMWCDPGWHGATLTLELQNVLSHNSLGIKPGQKIGQMIFYRGQPVPAHASYATRGQYNHQKGPQVSKGVR